MALASVALNDAKALLNDAAGTLFTDVVLMPYLQRAHRELQLKLNSRQSPTIKETSSIIDVIAGGPSDLAVPLDFIEPIRLEEKLDGSSEQFLPMVEQDWETNYNPQESLYYWTWREEAVKLPGSTTARDVRLYYKKGIPVPAAAVDSLGISRSEIFLGSRTASLAARFIMQDETRADQLDLTTIDALKEYLKTEVRGLQDSPARRVRYLTGRRYGTR